MGLVIRFGAAPSACPVRTSRPEEAEGTLLIAMRTGFAAFRRGDAPIPGPCDGLERAGACDAPRSSDASTPIVGRTIRAPSSDHCPRCPHLSADEADLPHAASLAQADEKLADRALRTALLSAPGAEFAPSSLGRLGTLFAGARLVFTRRRSPPGRYHLSAALKCSIFRSPVRLFTERYG
jgi:hypothetical protein